MADRLPRLHVVCYDIADPRRLVRIHRYLVKRGLALQYSVFLVYTHKAGLLDILAEIQELMEPSEDDVRAYPLPRNLEYTHLGRQLFPEGVTLQDAALPADLFTSAA